MSKKRVGASSAHPYPAGMINFDRIADSIDALAADQSLSLGQLAASANLSRFHFQRTFQRLVGVSPLRFQQVLKVEAARDALLRSKSVLEAAWDGGMSGPGRLHDALLRVEAMTPGELKTGVTLRWTVAPTSLGDVHLAASSRGLSGVTFAGLADLEARWPHATFVRDDDALKTEAAQLTRVLQGDRLTKPLSIVLHGTELQVAVWRALLAMPMGAVTTYGELAAHLGRPDSARAIGNAVGANHLAVLIPCHRVIQRTGALGGYRWGVARKAALLARELEGT